nr:hypothetical protein [Xanthomonadales bacterium]
TWLMNAPLLATPDAEEDVSKVRRVHRLEGGNVVAQMSMAPDLSRMVTVAITRDETDVMTMPLPGG